MGREFLKAGDALLLCGREEERVKAAVSALQAEWPGSEVLIPLLFSVTEPRGVQ